MSQTISDASVFGTVVLARRKALGYTQVQVAAFCGTGVRFISDLENGKPTIELGKALLVAQTLGVDIVARTRGASS